MLHNLGIRSFDIRDIHSELDGVGRRLGAQVVLPGLETALPSVEVHRRQLGGGAIHHVDVQALGLVDVGSAVSGHIDHALLLDLPDSLVELLDVLRHIQLLHRPIVGHQLLLHGRPPEPPRHQVPQQVLVHLHELTGQDTACVHVLGVRLEGLVVAQDLGGGGRGHGRHQQAVPHAVGLHTGAQGLPVPAAAVRVDTPQVELELPLRHGAALISFVGSQLLGQLTRSLHSPEIQGLKNLRVQPAGLVTLERQAHHHERVGQSLNPEADRTVSKVRPSRLLHRVKVPLNDLVQIAGRDLDNPLQFLEIEGTLILDEGWQSDGSQITDSNLVRGGELNNLGAQIGTANGAQVLLVGLLVAGVLVEHVRSARLHLALQDLEPQLLRRNSLPSAALSLVLLIQSLEIRAIRILQPWGFVGAEQGPRPLSLHALHEQVGDPQGVEQVARSLLLLAVVLAQFQEIKNIGVPGFEVHRKGALALAPALVHVASGVVEDAEHRHQTARRAVGPANVGA
mmetsp:Transcript_12173/g.26968  ORF Transcript_12173/g.26968 Transcript_12173/m.26968 type:complete len:510 (+) Transcript_12173:311-1840(+)